MTLAVGLDCPAMHFDQLADQGEPDSEPPLAAFQRRFGLPEWFKDTGQDLRINADAVISHADQEVVFVDTRRQPDAPSSIRELRGVVQKIGDDLIQSHRIRAARGVSLEP